MKPTTCALDHFPTALVKANTSVLSPLITIVINHSLQSGNVQSALKTAIIRPLLKKPTLAPDTLTNYRPISNLRFISKVLEKVVATHLQDHLKHNHVFLKNSSLVSVLIMAQKQHSLESQMTYECQLMLAHLPSSYSSTCPLLLDHGILLNQLHQTTGLTDTALNWFKSYLTDRTEYISLGSARSQQHTVTCGVPQGSVLGPILFIIYILPLGHVISPHGVSFHCFADDTQLYIKTDSQLTAASSTSS